MLMRTDLGNNPWYQLIYFDIAYYLFSFILPLLLLAVFNTQLIVTYRGVRNNESTTVSYMSELLKLRDNYLCFSGVFTWINRTLQLLLSM